MEAIGVRAGGARGAAATPKFGQLRFFGHLLLLYFEDTNIFYFNKRSRRNNSVTFTRESGCLARDEFLVIREGYHMLIFCCCCCWALYFTVLAGVGYFQS